MLKNLPKTIVLAILLLKALDLKEGIRLIQDIVYLWREFYIRIQIKPVIQKYKISFYYKDKRIMGTDVNDPKDLFKLIDDIRRTRADNE